MALGVSKGIYPVVLQVSLHTMCTMMFYRTAATKSKLGASG